MTKKQNRPKLYKTWINIKTRCYNKNTPFYKNYGGRGIGLSEKWQDFKTFQNDMLHSYKKGLSIDRIDNNKGYSKENCRWATKSEQAFNRREKKIEFCGITDTIGNWSRFFGFNHSTITNRINNYNWSVERALTEGNPYYV